jgi:hypothetical protein
MAVAQKGDAFILGLGGNTYTGVVVESVEIEKGADFQYYKGNDGETKSIIVSDAKSTIKLTGLMEDSGFTAPTVGAVVTINSIAYLCISVSTTYGNGIEPIKVTINGEKYESMTYS